MSIELHSLPDEISPIHMVLMCGGKHWGSLRQTESGVWRAMISKGDDFYYSHVGGSPAEAISLLINSIRDDFRGLQDAVTEIESDAGISDVPDADLEAFLAAQIAITNPSPTEKSS